MHPIHVLFGTESNNCADLADRTGRALEQAGFSAQIIDMGDFANAKLAELRTVLVITSTYGNGDPPSNAEALHAFVMKAAPPLPDLRFAVCALGDKTYDRFCQCGKDFDRRLEELGGTRLAARQDCDVDYEKPWKAWLERVLEAVRGLASADATSTAPVVLVDPITIEHHDAMPGTRRNPIMARVREVRDLSAPGSTKETIHVELELGGALRYEVGDSLGVWAPNDPALVDEILEAASCDGDAKITLRGVVHESGRGLGSMSLRDALATHLDLAHVDPRLREACGVPDSDAPGHVLDVLLVAEKPITAQQLAESLRPIAPRQYSIASSLLAHPDQAHFTIDVLRYELAGRRRLGVASTFFAERAPVGTEVPVYLHAAPHFRLPADDLSIVMIGPGTGIAPFRAFLEERAARGAKGRAWLFFGARNVACDFLYGDELRSFVERGVLEHLGCAFSRDQPERIYVQHRMREQARELRAVIEEGAVVYVCGDAKRMAPDVHRALAEILGEGDLERGLEKLGALDEAHRYVRDVY